jgi:hypothetical protein
MPGAITYEELSSKVQEVRDAQKQQTGDASAN